MNERNASLPLLAGLGVELEYMIVDAGTLGVRPISDRLIQSVCGTPAADLDRGAMAWSNELVLHLIELKTNGPVSSLKGLATAFHDEIREVNRRLTPFAAKLMPSGMHPWMDPTRETQLWPHEYAEVYQAYHRIFDCRSHGYANLQSMHLNLSFAGDADFARLHAAVRVLLPILPAVAASSPFVEGRHRGWLDDRLAVYRHNADRIPSIVGQIVPEPVFTQTTYQDRILHPMYQAIRPWDPEGQLQEEFLNARGAIARFDRGSIEIRLLDVQECPAADLALAQWVVAVLRLLTEEHWSSLIDLQTANTTQLEQVLLDTSRLAETAQITDRDYLRLFGWRGAVPCSTRALWHYLAEAASAADGVNAEAESCLEVVLREGPLARRLLQSLGCAPPQDRLREVYGQLCDCLADNRMYSVASP